MILIDTGFLVALLRRRDALHDRAVRWSVHAAEDLIVTEHVLWETLNFLAGSIERADAAHMVDRVRDDPGWRVIEASPELFEAGLAMYRSRLDKPWSLTDCISFHVMRERGVAEALAYDHHFEQAGFVALMRRDPVE